MLAQRSRRIRRPRHIDRNIAVKIDLPAAANKGRTILRPVKIPNASLQRHRRIGCMQQRTRLKMHSLAPRVHLRTKRQSRPNHLVLTPPFRENAHHTACPNRHRSRTLVRPLAAIQKGRRGRTENGVKLLVRRGIILGSQINPTIQRNRCRTLNHPQLTDVLSSQRHTSPRNFNQSSIRDRTGVITNLPDIRVQSAQAGIRRTVGRQTHLQTRRQQRLTVRRRQRALVRDRRPN